MIVVLHNIRSQYNVGSVFRTADALGFEMIYLTGYTPTPRDRFGNKRRRIAKVSLGAEDYLAWEKAALIAPLLRRLKAKGYKLLAIEQSKHSVPYSRFRIKNPKFALVLGNEITGLPKKVLSAADKILEIPMRGKKESLNVAVAFAIVGSALSRKH